MGHSDVFGGILSDTDIAWFLDHGDLKIEPFLVNQLQPASVDLRLGGELILPRGGRVLDPRYLTTLDDQTQSFLEHHLEPNGFVNVSTLEWVDMPPTLCGFLVGKSSLARLGLQVESAGLVDPGWSGKLTLELKNLGPDTIVLSPNMSICQMYFVAIFNYPCSRLYGDVSLSSRYQGAFGPQTWRPPRLRTFQEESEPAAPDPEMPPHG